MKLLSPIFFVLLILAPATIAQPVAAQAVETCYSEDLQYNCLTEEVVIREINPAYDNGLDGTVNISNRLLPYETWPAEYFGAAMPPGVFVGPDFETPARIFAAFNGTAYMENTYPEVTETSGYRSVPSYVTSGATGVIPAIEYEFNIPPDVVMNGVSSFFYRSPLVWNEDNFTAHILHITDEYGRLVVARDYIDNEHAQIIDGRLYYRVDAMIESGRNYTVQEFIRTDGGASISFIDVYLAPGQDVDGGGAQFTRFFAGQPGQRDIEEDLGYSFRFIYGMGPGGTMNLVPFHNNTTKVQIQIPAVVTSNGSVGQNQAKIIIPLRTTVPLNGTVTIYYDSDVASADFTTATGTLVLTTELLVWGTTTNPTVSIILDLEPHPTADCPVGAWEGCAFVSYPMYQRVNMSESLHSVSYYETFLVEQRAYEWAPWAEVSFEDVLQPANEDSSATNEDNLLSVRLILTGVLVLAITGLLVVVSAPVSVPILVGGAVVGAMSIAGGIALADDDLRELAAEAVRDAAAVLAVAACGGMFLAPGAYKLAAGAACALLASTATGNLPGLLDFVLRIPEIIKAAIEKLGEILTTIMQWVAPIAIPVLVLIGIFAILGVLVVPLKYALLGVLGGLAVLHGYERPTKYPLFKKVYGIYIPLYTELVERRMLKMEVKV